MSRPGALLACALLIAACSTNEAPLVAKDVVINAPRPAMRMSAGYLTLGNKSDAAITITGVMSPEFAAVEMHESILENGVSRMIELGELTIEAGATMTFEPGGKHLMLMGYRGESDSASLQFYAGDTLVLSVTAAVVR